MMHKNDWAKKISAYINEKNQRSQGQTNYGIHECMDLDAWTAQRDIIRLDESPLEICKWCSLLRVYFPHAYKQQNIGDGSQSRNIKAKFKQYETKIWIQTTMQVYYHSTSKMKTRSKL